MIEKYHPNYTIFFLFQHFITRLFYRLLMIYDCLPIWVFFIDSIIFRRIYGKSLESAAAYSIIYLKSGRILQSDFWNSLLICIFKNYSANNLREGVLTFGPSVKL